MNSIISSFSTRAVIGLAMLVACGVMVGGLSGCSNSPKPIVWVEQAHPDVRHVELEKTVRAIMMQKFGYEVINWHHDEKAKLITFETDWNSRDAHLAVFSGSGTRRKAWVEIEETLKDEDMSATLSARRPTPTGAKGVEPVYEVVDGKRLRVIGKFHISVIRERNVSIVYSAQVAEGDWKDAGDDEEEVQRIFADVKDAVGKLMGRSFGPSPQGEAAHRRYFEKSERPEDWRPSSETPSDDTRR